MDEWLTRYNPVRIWVGIVGVLAGVLMIGALVFPRQVYDGFLWRYFLGPVVADARIATCAVRQGGRTELFTSVVACEQASGIVAYPGYTAVSTVSYAVVLVIALAGVLFLLRYLEVGESPGFFFSLVPFMVFGGALRVLEDANIALVREGAAPVLPFPWTMLIISPFIYFTVFFIVLGVLLLAVFAVRRDILENYEPVLALGGTLALVGTLGYLGWLSVTTIALGFTLAVPVIVIGGATLLAGIIWVLTERYLPVVNVGTGRMGLVIVWGHAVDGLANVLSLDWGSTFGLPTYAPKHVVNRAVVDITARIQPPELSELIGTAWPFLFVKLGVAVGVVWLFDDRMFEENPRYMILLLIAVLAVGIGPGTRDFLRATFGI